MYTVPRYTEISHFRAPYKNSAIYTGVEGLGLVFSAPSSTQAAASSAQPSTLRVAPSGGTSGGMSQQEAAAAAAAFVAGQAKYFAQQQAADAYDPHARGDTFLSALYIDAQNSLRSRLGLQPWQSLTGDWPTQMIVDKGTVAIDPNSPWRNKVRTEVMYALGLGYGTKYGKALAGSFLNYLADKIGAELYANVGLIPGGADKIGELKWRINTEELNNDYDAFLRSQQKSVTTIPPIGMQSSVSRPVPPSGPATSAPPPQPQVTAPPFIDDQYGPPGPGPGPSPMPPATAAVSSALPWVAAAGVAGAVIWFAVRKKK